MDISLLEATAKALVRQSHGLLAADDSSKSSAKRFAAVNLEDSETSRRDYREMLMTAPEASNALAGVILFEETFYQTLSTGPTFPSYLASQGIIPGIKLDQGLQDLPGFPGEKVTAGLDTLPERAAQFSKDGAKFVKWRNVISIGEGIPTDECIGANTYILARYARICQDNNMVPIVEPEVLMDGNHTSEQCEAVTARVYDILFQTLRAFRVHLPGCIMKTAMVLPGKESEQAMDPNDVAERTVRVLKNHVPAELGGVVFLSGGQTTNQALVNLNHIEQKALQENLPFNVTFSYLRSLQDPALHTWAETHHKEAAQAVLDGLLEKASAARDGHLDETTLEHEIIGGQGSKSAWEY